MRKQFFLLFTIIPILSFASVAPSFEDQLIKIDQRIEALKKELKDIQVKELGEEVKGQGLMMADWSAYAKELELIRQLDLKGDEIQLQIKQLEEARANLIKQQTK